MIFGFKYVGGLESIWKDFFLLFSCVDCVVHFAYRNLWPGENKDYYVKNDASGHTQIIWFCFKQY
jgi:hypothetical protein